jgi:hypothetical protein
VNRVDPKQIREDATYFMGKLNIGASFLDARAFQIMNNNLGIDDMLKEIEELRKQNEFYRSLQDSNSFVFLEGMPDRPWIDAEIEIVNRHNARFAEQLRSANDKLEFVDRMGKATEVKPYDGVDCGIGAMREAYEEARKAGRVDDVFVVDFSNEKSVSFNPKRLKKLAIKGKVDVFCPSCGKTLWEELPDKSCIKCGQEIDHNDSEFITIDKLHEIIAHHKNASVETRS